MDWNPFEVQELMAHWTEIIKATEAVSREAAALLFVARPTCVVAGPVALVYLQTKYAFHQSRMMNSTLRPAIEIAFARVFGQPVAVDVQLEEAKKPGAATLANSTSAPITASPSRPRRARGPSRNGVVRAIPTSYAGIQMRSKLEANTAQLFDTCNIRWQYEVEGYDLGGVWYLPDFWLDDMRCFVEVKGILDSKSEQKVKLLAAACEGKGIHVILLRDLRMRLVDNYLTVIGDWVTPFAIEKDGAFMARCPRCNEVSWLHRGDTTCGRCAHDVRAAYQFVRVY